AIKHFGGGNVVDGATKVASRVGVEVRKRGVFLSRLMVGKGVVHNRVLGDLRQRDVFAHVVQVRSVVLPHDEELPAVAEYGRTNAALFEARILLNNRDVPAIELSQLGVALLNNFLSAGDVEETGDFFVDVSLSQRALERNDVLARMVGDEETGG